MSTVRQIHAILSGTFSEAERDGVIATNPCRHARIPAALSGKELGHEISVWSRVDLRRFLAATECERYGVLWRFLAMTGARRSEALRLRWSDLDLDGPHARAAIRRALTVASDGNGSKPVMFAPTKSGKARVIDLDAATAEALRVHRDRQAAEREAAGERWADDAGGPLVFARDTWRPLRGDGGRAAPPREAVPPLPITGGCSRPPQDQAPRPAPWLGNDGLAGRCASQGGSGAARPLRDQHHPQHVLARRRGAAARGC